MLFNLNQFVCDFEAIPDPNFFLSLTWHVTISIESIAWKHLFSVGLGKNFSSCGTFTIYFQNVLKQLLRLSLVFRKKNKIIIICWVPLESPRPPHWQHYTVVRCQWKAFPSFGHWARLIPSVRDAWFTHGVCSLRVLFCWRRRRWRVREPYNGWLCCHSNHGWGNERWHHWDRLHVSVSH